MRVPGLLLAVTVVIAATGAGEAITVLQERAAAHPSAQAQLSAGDGRLSVTLQAGSSDVPFRVVAGSLVLDRPVDVLADAAYPNLLTTTKSAKGLFDHLSSVLNDSGWTAPIRRIDAATATAVVAGDPSRILVSGSGALPDTLSGPRHDFGPVHDWLSRGGELVFIGDGIGYWAAHAGATFFSLADTRARVDWNGEMTLFGRHLVHDATATRDPSPGLFGRTRSPIAAQLEVAYTPAFRGALVSDLAAVGGWDAGWDTTGPGPVRTSLAVIPVGAGRVILFGGGLYSAEEQVADDMARLLLSGADVAPTLVSSSTDVGAGRRQTVSLAIGAAAPGVRVFVVASNDFGYFRSTVRVRA